MQDESDEIGRLEVENENLRQRAKALEGELANPEEVRRALAEDACPPEAPIDCPAEGICVCHAIPGHPFLRFTVWNARMVQITGYQMEEINRLGWPQALYPDGEGHTKAREHMERMRQGEDLQDGRWEVTRADGQKRVLAISTSQLPGEDGMTQTLALIRDVTDRRGGTVSLRPDEERLEALLQHSSDIVSIFDEQGNLVYNSPAAQRIHGFTTEELARKNTFAFVHPDDRPLVLETFSRLLKSPGTVQTVQYRYATKDGKYVWIESVGSYQPRNPAIAGVVVNSRDISERKAAEEALRTSEEKYRTLIESARDAIFLADAETGVILEANHQAEVLLGRPAREIIGMHQTQLHPPGEAERYRAMFFEQAQSGKFLFRNLLVRRSDGRDIPVDFSASMADIGGRRIVQGIFQDITDRMQAEERLRTNEQMLQTIINTIPHFVFWKDRNSRYLGCNELFAKSAGLEKAEHILGKTDHDLIWREEADLYRNDDKQVVETGEPKFRYIELQTLSGGSRIWAEKSKVPLRDAENRIMGVLGIFQDITERKRAELEQQQLVAIIEHSSDFIGIVDANGRMLYLNEAGRKLVGIDSLSEARTMSIQDYVVTEDLGKMSQEMSPAIREKGSWTGEFRLRHFASGASIPVEMNAFLIRDAQTGEPIALGNISRDIAERKRTEAALRELVIRDPLTGAFNRRHFFSVAEQAFKQARRYGLDLAALMIDADDFKAINDRYGHAVGDQTLTTLVARLRQGLRDADILGRYGGEEFVVLMLETDLHGAAQAAERLRQHVRSEPLKAEREDVPLTISVGVAALDHRRDRSISDLICRADEALFKAKDVGRDCVRLWEASLEDPGSRKEEG